MSIHDYIAAKGLREDITKLQELKKNLPYGDKPVGVLSSVHVAEDFKEFLDNQEVKLEEKFGSI